MNCKWRRTDVFESRSRRNAPIKSMIADSMGNITQILNQTIIDNNSQQFENLINRGMLDPIILNNKSFMIVHQMIHNLLKYNRIECLKILFNGFITQSASNININTSTNIVNTNPNTNANNQNESVTESGDSDVTTPLQQQAFFRNKFNLNDVIGKIDIEFCENPLESLEYLSQISKLTQNKVLFSIDCCHGKLFHKCCEYGFDNCVEFCILQGCNVTICSNRAIRDSARFGHLNIIKLLIKHGADYHSCKEEALRKACRHGHLEIVKYLCEMKSNRNVDISARNYQAIEWATRNGHTEVVRYLLLQRMAGIIVCNDKYKKNSDNDIRRARRDLLSVAVDIKQWDILGCLLTFGFMFIATDAFYINVISKYDLLKLFVKKPGSTDAVSKMQMEKKCDVFDKLHKAFDQRKREVVKVLTQFVTLAEIADIVSNFELMIVLAQ